MAKREYANPEPDFNASESKHKGMRCVRFCADGKQTLAKGVLSNEIN